MSGDILGVVAAAPRATRPPLSPRFNVGVPRSERTGDVGPAANPATVADGRPLGVASGVGRQWAVRLRMEEDAEGRRRQRVAVEAARVWLALRRQHREAVLAPLSSCGRSAFEAREAELHLTPAELESALLPPGANVGAPTPCVTPPTTPRRVVEGVVITAAPVASERGVENGSHCPDSRDRAALEPTRKEGRFPTPCCVPLGEEVRDRRIGRFRWETQAAPCGREAPCCAARGGAVVCSGSASSGPCSKRPHGAGNDS